MSKDIRSFFSVISKKSVDTPKPIRKSKIPRIVIESDDEDVVQTTPEKPNSKKSTLNKRKAQVFSSDSEDDSKIKRRNRSPQKKTKNVEEKPKLKPVSIDDIFKDKTVKQSKVVNVPKVETNKSDRKSDKKDVKSKKRGKKNIELGIHGDKDFEKTLMELDEDSDDTILLDNIDLFDKTINEAIMSEHILEEKNNENVINTSDKKEIDTNADKNDIELVEKNKDMEEHMGKSRDTSKKLEKKRHRRDSYSNVTPSKKQKLEHSDSGIDPDQEKWERRHQSAVLYQRYLNRGGPKHHGEKEIPTGKPDCLKNLTFLRTGVLDSLESEEFEELLKNHGGRVVHAVSRKVNYVVVGDEPGPAKLEKARNYNIPEISEDELLDMILVKSGMKPKYSVRNDSEDLGLGSSENGSPKSEKSDKTKRKSIEPDKQSLKVCTSSKKTDKGIQNHKDKRLNLKKLGDKSYRTSDNSKEDDKKVEKIKSPLIKKAVEVQEKNESKMENRRVIKSDTEDKKITPSVSNEIAEFAGTSKNSGNTESSAIEYNNFTENLPWTEKYRPSTLKNIIGQQDSESNLNKLKKWLQNWFINQNPENRKKIPRPTPYYQGGGEWFKAALLSGPPGVGKTTTATLVAKELGFDVVEFNASDTRNKKLLHEELSQMMKIKSVAGYISGEHNLNKKRVLIMDEVDGMAGNEDRGGIAELICFIKSSKFPIICMCNDRSHPKMRTLVNYCYGLRFGKPNVKQIMGAMLSICFKEGLNIKPDALSQLIVGTGCDIRQTLNHLTMWSAAEKNLSLDTVQKESKNSQKDLVIGTWDVVRKVFNSSENKDMSTVEKSRLFFYDYSAVPLFVQENYLEAKPNCTGRKKDRDFETLIRKSLTAECLSVSDLIESKIRSTNNWSLLECQAFYCTVLPSHYMSGTLGNVKFPGWFGKNSQRNKSLRIIRELHSHAGKSISGEKCALRLDYAKPLQNLLLSPLIDHGIDGIRETMDVMKSYSLLRDDMSNLCELLNCFGNQNEFNKINSKVKSALTRLYNKEMVLTFAPPVAKKKMATDEYMGEEEVVSDNEEESDLIDNDTFIRVKTKDSTKAGNSKASGSKNESQSKGKASKSNATKAATKGKGKK